MPSGAMKRFVGEGSCPHAIQAKVIATAAVATFVPYLDMPMPSEAIVAVSSRYYDKSVCSRVQVSAAGMGSRV